MTTNVQSGPIEHRIGRNGELRLNTVAGTVSIRGTDGEDVRVVARTSGGGEPELNVRRYEGGLFIEPERQGTRFFGATIGIGVPDIEFEIELPRGASLELSTVNADVSASGLGGDQHYKLVSGDLELLAAGGRLTAKSVSGDMRVEASQPVALEAVTTSGDIELHGERLDQVRLRSVSGDIVIAGGFAAGPDHRVETVSGDLRLEPTRGVSIHASGPILGLASDIGGRRGSRRGQRDVQLGNGAASLRFRTLSGQLQVSDRTAEASVEASDVPVQPADELEILRALERGEIDVEEASRRLSGEAGNA